jgi:transposase
MDGSITKNARKVDERLPRNRNSNCHAARLVYDIISMMIRWVLNSSLSRKNSL